MNLTSISLGMLGIIMATTSSNCCNDTPDPAATEYQVSISEITNADVPNTLKELKLAVTAPAGYHTSQILLSNWFAGHNTGAPANNLQVNFDGSFNFPTPLLQSEQLNTCEAMYFIFTISYINSSGQPGAFVSQTERVMPTKERNSSGQLVTALCAEPPPPEAN